MDDAQIEHDLKVVGEAKADLNNALEAFWRRGSLWKWIAIPAVVLLMGSIGILGWATTLQVKWHGERNQTFAVLTTTGEQIARELVILENATGDEAQKRSAAVLAALLTSVDCNNRQALQSVIDQFRDQGLLQKRVVVSCVDGVAPPPPSS